MMKSSRPLATLPPTIAVDGGDLREQTCDVLVVGVFTGGIEGPGVATVLDGLGLPALPITPEFRGDIGQHLMLAAPGLPWKTILFVGLGRMVATDATRMREAAGVAVSSGHLWGRVVTTLALVHPTTAAIAALAEGFCVGRPPRPSAAAARREPGAPHIMILAPTAMVSEGRRAAHRGVTMARATIAARDLVDTPPNHRPPFVLAEQMMRLTAAACDSDLYDRATLERAGFGGTLSAGRGAEHDPCVLTLRYEPDEPLGHVVLCGRGTTFGSGGLSLRRGRVLEAGKADMAGAAAIAGACSVLRDLDVRVGVTALLGLVESMPGGDAQRPGDVVTTRGGLTVELVDADADALLILADLIDLAHTYEPDSIVDVTTAGAGAVGVLGDDAGAVMGNDATLIDALLAAADRAGEPLWQLPLWDRLDRRLRSPIADVVSGAPFTTSAIATGLVLRRVARATPWAHVDCGSAALVPQSVTEDGRRPGATGYGARTLAGWLEHRTAHVG